MKTNKVPNIIFIVAFLLAISLPLVFADFKGGNISPEENRYLATFPQFVNDEKVVFNARDFDKWINDNIGGRSFAQTIEEKASYKLSMQHKGDVIEGKEKWLYLIPDNDMSEYTNAELSSEEKRKELCQKYEYITEKFDDMGIEFVLAMYPRKYHVYPEYMPDTIKRLNSTSDYDLISADLKQSKINYVDPYSDLIEAKKTRQTYSKAADTSHWNQFGAYIAYQCLIEKIKEVLPDVQMLSDDDFEITEIQQETKKRNGFYTSETDLYYELKCPRAISDKEYLFNSLNFKSTDQWQSYNYFQNSDLDLPKGIIIGDSYTWMFHLEYLAQSFSRLIFIHYNDLSELNHLIYEVKPDLVVGAFLSSAIWPMSNWMPEEITNKEESMGIKPVVEYEGWGYHNLDYCCNYPVEEHKIKILINDDCCHLEGWALDPLIGSTASSVIIQVGDQYYEAKYGKERETVATYFQNDEYLKCGYVLDLKTEDVISTQSITIHVISKDGTYQYPSET